MCLHFLNALIPLWPERKSHRSATMPEMSGNARNSPTSVYQSDAVLPWLLIFKPLVLGGFCVSQEAIAKGRATFADDRDQPEHLAQTLAAREIAKQQTKKIDLEYPILPFTSSVGDRVEASV